MATTLPKAIANVFKQTKNVQLPLPQVSNGTGAFVFPCRKLVLNYCETSGSSKGMIDFLLKDSIELAQKHPMVEIIVQPRPSRHPIVRAFYANGRTRVTCVKNIPKAEVKANIERLLGFAGFENRLWKEHVLSTTPSVRGIWSPFHTTPYTFKNTKKN